MKIKIFPLLLGGLGLGVSEFIMMGLLPDIAADLKISIPKAGYLISAYALGVVIGAPLLVALAAKYPPKKILFFLIAMFVACNAMTIVAPNFILLLVSRLLSGLPHGAFFGVASVVAGKIGGKQKAAQAVSILFMGLTLANVIGVPLGTFIGQLYSWRITFGIVVLIGIAALVCLVILLPEVHMDQVKEEDIVHDSFFKNRSLWVIIVMISIGQGGFFCWYSYISPLMTNVSHFKAQDITYILILSGLGMTLGSYLGGRFSDQYSPVKTVVGAFIVMTISLILVHFVSFQQIASLVMTFFTGAAAFALVPSIQMLMIQTAKGSEMLGASVSQACFNIGNALGAWLGGLPLLAGRDYTWPSVVGVVMAFIGGVMAYWFLRSFTKPKFLNNHNIQ